MTTRASRSPRRRTIVALAVVLAVLAGFIVRLVDIQVVNADEHIADSQALALGAREHLYGTRGEIVDADGDALATSILMYDGKLDPLNVGPIEREVDGVTVEVPWEQVSAEMAAITGQTAAEVQGIVAQALAKDPGSRFAYLKRGLTTEQYRALAELRAPYLRFDMHPQRTYPDGAVAGNLLGFMGGDGEPLAGIEQMENTCLSAADGERLYQRGKDGVVIPGTVTETPAVDGGTLQLTIDRDLQWYLQQLVAEEVQNKQANSGAILVVEVATGKIRAAAEYPTVDPNNVDGSAAEDRGSRLFLESYEPGSTLKAITAASVIDAGVATPDTTVTAGDYEVFPNGARVGDFESHPVLNYTLTGALIDSSNVALSKFGEMLSAEVRHDYLERFGVGRGTAVGWPQEPQGVLYPASEWDNQTFYATTFGQGFTMTSPQVASAYQALANGGIKMPLSLVESCTLADGTVVEPDLPEPERVVSQEAADAVTLMLENVAVQAQMGPFIAVDGYRIAAKTGTAQIAGDGAYKAGVYFTSLIGIVPADDPQYIVLTTLDEPTTIKSSAANRQAFQKAMTQVLKNYRVLPSGSQTPLLPKTH
ncbi:penicillin-binding protein 2 [Microbacterium sp. zg.Y1090]|uniref:peptidoglycan D,D-transpeptidase FtsI family protein n=1 Tax=Microbacterium TaxID=33882 RepID=UPI00214BAF08|nr:MULTISPECIES: penicillin-binding protein 2 [unclassified Microbacterium]MCR2811431.1 penicillin-binding protein 2 [Microbacterium sp. zg.Y1084]MCR2819151.1 penicillin-binding protein 2 [Microbacterium sp. zg.Y1090]MDL5487850.1 penicillin-binding protein 2 [Microbacterium sp. zg-Y1211]WIM27452.1 penicillin-binding protein 2 [Microbacterium sp. zg-Y1090]